MKQRYERRCVWQQRLALFLYQLCIFLAMPVLWVGILWRGLRQRSYWQKLPQRLGYIDVKPGAWGGILVHAASLGEVHAAQPLIDALLERYPARMLTVSCQTPTGLAQVEKQWRGQVRAVYLPFDSRGACQRFLDRLAPRLLILLERELWPTLLSECEQRVIPVALVNARLSERSARQSQRFAWLMQPVLAQLCAVHAADLQSAQRLKACGAAAQVVELGGNLKFDIPIQEAWREDVLKALGAVQQRPVVLLASTHEGEEAQALAAWPEFLKKQPQALLVIVPRHPHRFEQVAKLIASTAMRFVRRSSHKPVALSDAVLLVDAMGELQQWYRLATVCAVAGSWANVGGHNALEALLVGKGVLFGPHTHNFETLYAELEQIDAGERTASVAQLMVRAMHGLEHPARLEQRNQAALTWVQSHRGSTARAMAQLTSHLPPLLSEPQEQRLGNDTVWRHPALVGEILVPWQVDLDVKMQTPAHKMQGGRGKVKLLQHQGLQFVLRHAHRGGLMGKILGDRFLRTKPYLSRSIQELHLLNLMQSWHLPAPMPAAARHQAGLVFDRCDLMMVYVDNSMSLHTLLCQKSLDAANWQAIGSMIARFHARQIDHVDLNCHNLLLQSLPNPSSNVMQPVLIDFDKCDLRSGNAWKQANLDRLLRSLKKEKRLLPGLHWGEDQWPWLMQGYARVEPML